MKKITLLILFFAVSFVQNAQSYKYHEVRDLGITFSQANTNFCNNILGQQIKLNIFIGSPLIVGNIYFIENIDGVDKYVKITKASSRSNQDADEFVDGTNIGAPIGFTCVIDSDSDGVPDSQDNCPNEAGPSYNNGCPTIPKVSLIKAQISQSGNTWNVLNHQSPLIEMNWSSFENPKTTFRFTLKNIGGTNYGQGNREIDVHMSDKSVLGTGPIQLFNVFHGNFSQIPTNGEYNINFDRNFSAAPNPTTGAFALFEGKTYYFHFLIKAPYLPPPPLYANPPQHYVFPFKVNRLDVNNLTFDLSSLELGKKEEPYQISIYSFSGQKVLSREVNNVEQENSIIQNLKKDGIYIVKSKNSTRKVYVGND